jgi:hypothetical protein
VASEVIAPDEKLARSRAQRLSVKAIRHAGAPSHTNDDKCRERARLSAGIWRASNLRHSANEEAGPSPLAGF